MCAWLEVFHHMLASASVAAAAAASAAAAATAYIKQVEKVGKFTQRLVAELPRLQYAESTAAAAVSTVAVSNIERRLRR
jgi:hypothetical protein